MPEVKHFAEAPRDFIVAAAIVGGAIGAGAFINFSEDTGSKDLQHESQMRQELGSKGIVDCREVMGTAPCIMGYDANSLRVFVSVGKDALSTAEVSCVIEPREPSGMACFADDAYRIRVTGPESFHS